MNTYIFAKTNNCTDKIAHEGTSIQDAYDKIDKWLISGFPIGFKLFSIDKKSIDQVAFVPYIRGKVENKFVKH